MTGGKHQSGAVHHCKCEAFAFEKWSKKLFRKIRGSLLAFLDAGNSRPDVGLFRGFAKGVV